MTLKYNPKDGTFERQDHRYELQDAAEPNLMRDIFPYDKMPRIPFNHRYVPMNPPDEIWVTDTTFRDGQQAMKPFTVQQIVDLYKLLHRLSGPKGIIRMSEFFLYTPHDREALDKCRELGYKYPEVTSWIRASTNDFKLVRAAGVKETGILMSCSDYHIYLKLKKTRKQAMEDYLAIAEAALANGITPRCHLEDLTRADFYGFAVPFVQKLMELAKKGNATVKIRMCDTLGYGVAYPGSALPRSVQGIVYGLRHYAGVPAEWLEWHGHNDFYRGLNNASTAWLYGCCAANGTLLGIGERTGNTPIEGLVVELLQLRGGEEFIDTTVITEIAEYFEREIGYKVPHNTPIVGAEFNLTRAGIHADGLFKSEEIYNAFNTEKLLKRPIKIAISDKSGTSGVSQWINTKLHLEGTRRVTKDHPNVHKIKEWIDQEYAKGRTTTISDEEMFELCRQHFPEYFNGAGSGTSVSAPFSAPSVSAETK